MGLGSFIDPAWNTHRFFFRLVLKPAFHPEFCLTILSGSSTPEIAAVCLSEMLWQQVRPRQLPVFHERRKLDQSLTDRIESLCSTIDINAKRPICLDGMGLNAVWTNNGELVEFNSHVYAETVSKFVATILEIAWDTFTVSGIRNGIANCGQYVGLKYSLEPEPHKPTQLLVLGNPDDVSDYLEQLRKHRDGA